MSKKLFSLLLICLLFGAALVGCGNSSVQNRASSQIAAANASLADAKAKGVQVPQDEQQLIQQAESKLKSDSVEALVLATEAKANIDNDIQDAFALAEQTYNTTKGTAQGAISSATAGADLTQAKQSLQTADAKKSQAKTIQDYYNASDGPIYWANLAAQQATAASLAKATSQAQQQAAAQAQKEIEQASTQIPDLMKNYLISKGFNPADYKLGITRVSASDVNWATGSAAPLAPVPGSQPILFLFHYENGNWVLKAAPMWTAGQFGAPADMVP